jgi:hypothetical protein
MAPKPSRLVVIESPYTMSTVSRQEYVRYALWACADATHDHHEACIASHLIWTMWLEEDPMSRDWGLACRDFWARAAVAAVVRYVDLGTTPGMFREQDSSAVVETRRLGDWAGAGWDSGRYPPGTIRPQVVG